MCVRTGGAVYFTRSILSNSPSILILRSVFSEKCMLAFIYKATPPLGLDLQSHMFVPHRILVRNSMSCQLKTLLQQHWSQMKAVDQLLKG